MQVVILAGGLGTRLGQLTERTPKSMIRILDKPFLQYQIELLRGYGIKNILLCIGHLGYQIKQYFGQGEKFGVKIYYSEEGKNLLGTGGSIKNAESMLCPVFGVLYGDSYLEIDYCAVFDAHRKEKMPMTMTVWRNFNNYDSSNVSLSVDGRRVVRYEKNKKTSGLDYIDYGFSILSKSIVINRLKTNVPAALDHLFAELSKENLINSYVVNKRFYEIGSVSGIKDLEKYLLNSMQKRDMV